jgi:hypothetical protein
MTILGGIIFKIAVIVFLIKALGNAKEAQQLKEEFDRR